MIEASQPGAQAAGLGNSIERPVTTGASMLDGFTTSLEQLNNHISRLANTNDNLYGAVPQNAQPEKAPEPVGFFDNFEQRLSAFQSLLDQLDGEINRLQRQI
jgi:exonuclease VII small subunit